MSAYLAAVSCQNSCLSACQCDGIANTNQWIRKTESREAIGAAAASVSVSTSTDVTKLFRVLRPGLRLSIAGPNPEAPLPVVL